MPVVMDAVWAAAEARGVRPSSPSGHASGLVTPDIAVVRTEAARDAELSLPAAAKVAVIEIVSPRPGASAHVCAAGSVEWWWRVERRGWADRI
jgi:hypothetical protein